MPEDLDTSFEIEDTLVKVLKARALRSERKSVSERVRVDTRTLELLVEFVEAERCSLKEALRRAVRLGVQILLAERQQLTEVQPWESAVSSNYTAPVSFGSLGSLGPSSPSLSDACQQIQQSQCMEPIPTFSEMKQGDGSSDYTRTRPPGLV